MESEILFESKYNKCCLSFQFRKVIIGACVIIPNEYKETPFDLTYDEWIDTQLMIEKAKSYLDEKYNPDGYNIGWNIGKIAGQECKHVHLHIIPRYKDEPYAGKGIRHWIKKSNNKYLHENEISKSITRPIIFSLAAISGGGKTAITNYLCNELDNAEAIYFDDYEYDKQPENIRKWVDEGCNMNEWDLTKFEDVLNKKLENGKLNYIILDYPFAYQHNQIAKYIDLAFFIDTPLDIALTRRIIRDSDKQNKADIINGLKQYVNISREYFKIPEKTRNMKTDSDIIIDGSFSIKKIAEKIIFNLNKIDNVININQC